MPKYPFYILFLLLTVMSSEQFCKKKGCGKKSAQFGKNKKLSPECTKTAALSCALRYRIERLLSSRSCGCWSTAPNITKSKDAQRGDKTEDKYKSSEKNAKKQNDLKIKPPCPPKTASQSELKKCCFKKLGKTQKQSCRKNNTMFSKLLSKENFKKPYCEKKNVLPKCTLYLGSKVGNKNPLLMKLMTQEIHESNKTECNHLVNNGDNKAMIKNAEEQDFSKIDSLHSPKTTLEQVKEELNTEQKESTPEMVPEENHNLKTTEYSNGENEQLKNTIEKQDSDSETKPQTLPEQAKPELSNAEDIRETELEKVQDPNFIENNHLANNSENKPLKENVEDNSETKTKPELNTQADTRDSINTEYNYLSNNSENGTSEKDVNKQDNSTIKPLCLLQTEPQQVKPELNTVEDKQQTGPEEFRGPSNTGHTYIGNNNGENKPLEKIEENQEYSKTTQPAPPKAKTELNTDEDKRETKSKEVHELNQKEQKYLSDYEKDSKVKNIEQVDSQYPLPPKTAPKPESKKCPFWGKTRKHSRRKNNHKCTKCFPIESLRKQYRDVCKPQTKRNFFSKSNISPGSKLCQKNPLLMKFLPIKPLGPNKIDREKLKSSPNCCPSSEIKLEIELPSNSPQTFDVEDKSPIELEQLHQLVPTIEKVETKTKCSKCQRKKGKIFKSCSKCASIRKKINAKSCSDLARMCLDKKRAVANEKKRYKEKESPVKKEKRVLKKEGPQQLVARQEKPFSKTTEFEIQIHRGMPELKTYDFSDSKEKKGRQS